MPRPSKLTDAQKQEIIKLHTELHVSYRDLAQQYGVSSNTILRICEPDIYKKHLANAKKYQKKNLKAISAQRKTTQRKYYLILNRNEDADLIAHLDSQDNVVQYIKDLIIKDIQTTGKKSSD